MALLRFGRVDEERAVLSLDGEVEGIESGSEARSQVAADIICAVERAHEPAFCGACGTALAPAAQSATSSRAAGSSRPATWPRPAPAASRRCAAGPPAYCTACGAAYEDEGMQHQADELLLAYTCTCPAGHTVSGVNAV